MSSSSVYWVLRDEGGTDEGGEDCREDDAEAVEASDESEDDESHVDDSREEEENDGPAAWCSLERSVVVELEDEEAWWPKDGYLT